LKADGTDGFPLPAQSVARHLNKRRKVTKKSRKDPKKSDYCCDQCWLITRIVTACSAIELQTYGLLAV